MNIGVDLDEVLGDFLSSLIQYHNTNYNSVLSREDFHSYKFWEVWGGTKEEAIQKLNDNEANLESYNFDSWSENGVESDWIDDDDCWEVKIDE